MRRIFSNGRLLAYSSRFCSSPSRIIPGARPPEIIAKLNAALNEGLADSKIKAQFTALGGVTAPLAPAEYGNVIVSETENWGKMIRAANIKAQ